MSFAASTVPELPLIRYRLRFSQVRHQNGRGYRSIAERDYLGSAWRGAFGRALRVAVCVTKLPTCDSCRLLQSCVYPWLFESRTPPGARKLTLYPRTPGPFVLEPADSHFDSKPDSLNLGVILFGQANRQLPYVVHALERAGSLGLTSKRIRFSLEDVQVEEWWTGSGILKDAPANEVDIHGVSDKQDPLQERAVRWKTVYRMGESLSSVQTAQCMMPTCPSRVHIRLITPLRMRQDNRLVNEDCFSARGFFSILVRRISMLTNFFSEAPLETDFAALIRRAESLSIFNRAFEWRDLMRYSSRQNRKVPMGGLVGQFCIEGASMELLWPYLWLGQWTHVGRSCSMGLGRYVLEPVEGKGEKDTEIRSHACPWPSPLRL